jgi:toxin-antitoxin system PIN domain toxin
VIELPDVNVLVALLWERHVHHGEAVAWFGARAGPFATTSITQTGFVRVSSHPRLSGRPLAVADAVATLRTLCEHPHHRFLADDRGFVANPLVPHDVLIGHRQVTDAHLLGIARASDAVVVTFDRGCSELGGETVRLLG